MPVAVTTAVIALLQLEVWFKLKLVTGSLSGTFKLFNLNSTTARVGCSTVTDTLCLFTTGMAATAVTEVLLVVG